MRNTKRVAEYRSVAKGKRKETPMSSKQSNKPQSKADAAQTILSFALGGEWRQMTQEEVTCFTIKQTHRVHAWVQKAVAKLTRQ